MKKKTLSQSVLLLTFNYLFHLAVISNNRKRTFILFDKSVEQDLLQ